MARALQLAANGRGFTSPNPMVGAVIVCDGRIIGEGWHRCFGGPHAEVNAVRSVADTSLLKDSTIYVTLEPCSHYGKTPPCAELLINVGIPRVVVGSLDPNEKVAGRGVRMLRESGAEVVVGVMEEECRELNRAFMTAHTLRRPYVMLKWACSADGYLDAVRDSLSPAPHFSTPETMMAMHRIRADFDAIMVGSQTVINDNPSLNVRLYPGRSPRKVVIDRRGRLTDDYRIFTGEKPLVYACDLDMVLSDLFKQGIISLMVEGGPTLLKSFIDAGLWDDARIEISPRHLGSSGQSPLPIPPGDIVSIFPLATNRILSIRNIHPQNS